MLRQWFAIACLAGMLVPSVAGAAQIITFGETGSEPQMLTVTDTGNAGAACTNATREDRGTCIYSIMVPSAWVLKYNDGIGVDLVEGAGGRPSDRLCVTTGPKGAGANPMTSLGWEWQSDSESGGIGSCSQSTAGNTVPELAGGNNVTSNFATVLDATQLTIMAVSDVPEPSALLLLATGLLGLGGAAARMRGAALRRMLQE
jgi:hypothetical protein